MESYYVVKRGHQPGIYKTWPECKTAVDGFKNPIFKKFSSFDDANAFFKSPLSNNNNNNTNNNNKKAFVSTVVAKVNEPDKINIETQSKISAEEMQRIKDMVRNIKSAPFSDQLNYNVRGWNCIENDIYIFTDGSSRKSREVLNSGVGVYLGYQCINIKEQYSNRTNNQCELQAMDYAFKLIILYWRELSEIGKSIKIVSDSEYSIKACSVWLNQWKANNWRTSGGDAVKNKELIESIDASMSRIKLINSRLDEDKKIRVKLIHINSHQAPDMQDKFKFSVWFGNYVADALSQNTV
jgi:ribonuclease HI